MRRQRVGLHNGRGKDSQPPRPAHSVTISDMFTHPKKNALRSPAPASYLFGDERIWDAAGIPVAHDHIRRPKTLTRMRRIRRNAAILFGEGERDGIPGGPRVSQALHAGYSLTVSKAWTPLGAGMTMGDGRGPVIGRLYAV